MLKLLILADDLTGALDTGVQLAARGVAAPVLRAHGAGGSIPDLAALTAQAAVLDLQTRHLTSAEAYRRVYAAAAKAAAMGVPYLYKKTDSGLRGNIGAELQAVVDASGREPLAFVPAFPQMGRVTRGGVHYAGGVPISMSSFGRDLLNPVRFDAVPDIIAEQSALPVHLFSDIQAFSDADDIPQGVLVFDAETSDDLRRIAGALPSRGVRLFAGCAALARFLPEMLPLAPEPVAVPTPSPDVLIISGSVSPLSFAQTHAARASGIPVVSLADGDRLSADSQAVSRRLLPAMRGAYARRGMVLLCACTSETEIIDGAKAQGIHRHITDMLAQTAFDFFRSGGRPTLAVNGGDTLAATLRAFGTRRIEPALELLDGIPLSKLSTELGELWMVSKSGSFGPETVFAEIQAGLAALTCGK